MIQLYGLGRIVSVPITGGNYENIIFAYFIAAVIEIMVALSFNYKIQFLEIMNMHPSFIILLVKGSGQNRGGLIKKIMAVPMYNFRIGQAFWGHF